MIAPEEVKKLAALARVRVGDAELPGFIKEFEGILAYVGQLDALSIPESARGVSAVPVLHNAFRGDVVTNETGSNTEKLTRAFPAREGDALSVKQIISHDE